MTNIKWERSKNTGAYRFESYRIDRPACGRMCKDNNGLGWNVYYGVKKVNHFNTLKEAKVWAESLLI